MKIIGKIWIGFLITVFMACNGGAGMEDQESLSIMSYNIHRGQDADNQDQLKEIARFIKESGAEIVGLQEVDSVCYRSDQVDQAAVLGELTGMHYAFVRHFEFEGGAYGQALLSKYPISNVVNQRLPIVSDPPGETRAFLTADVELPSGNKWTVGVAHLDYRSADSRVRQAKMAADILMESEHPSILLGDMNAEPGSETISVLRESFRDTQPDDSFTFPDDHPIKKIDFIFIEKTYDFEVLEQKVFPVRYSDHLPVLSVIRGLH